MLFSLSGVLQFCILQMAEDGSGESYSDFCRLTAKNCQTIVALSFFAP